MKSRPRRKAFGCRLPFRGGGETNRFLYIFRRDSRFDAAPFRLVSKRPNRVFDSQRGSRDSFPEFDLRSKLVHDGCYKWVTCR